jgi:murein DD-endopeptidase MepM/ murein hydrolase activator NlpD
LSGLQLLCCAAVAWAGLNAAQLTRPVDLALLAMQAFESARPQDLGMVAALAVADPGLSRIDVVIERNDTLDQIFRRLQLSLNDLANLRAIGEVRSMLDSIRPGELLTLIHRSGELVGLSRQLSISQTLKVERDVQNNFVANVEEIPLQRQAVSAQGLIESSLFLAGTVAGMRDATTLALAEIFRWDVDFMLDLRAGDTFKVVYEQIENDGEIVGDGPILAAEFVNEGRVYRAVRYETQDGKADYYTPAGQSLRKAFLKAPVQFSRISSVFNPHRKHPVLNRIRAHKGVDYAAPSGTPVRAAGEGRVSFRGVKGGFGNEVEIEHAGHVVTRYGHLSRFAQGIRVGGRVAQGDVIAFVGKTGLATGPHLHFEYIAHGVNLDPQVVMRQAAPGPPISPALRADFAVKTAPLLAQLESDLQPKPDRVRVALTQ